MFDVTPAIEKMQSMITQFIALIPNLLVGLVIFLMFLLLGAVVRRATESFARRTGLARNAQFVLGRLMRTLVVLLGLLMVFPIVFPQVTGAQVIEVLGIGGVAVGFAFRDVLQNFLAGILLFITQPFKIGDEIIFKEFEGRVEDIQTRATMLRTYDGRRVVLPNAELFIHAVVVNTAYPIRRSQYDVGVGYGDDIDLARRLIVEAVASVPEVLDTPAPEALVVDLAPSSVNIRARWWTGSARGDQVSVQGQVVFAIKQTLSAHGIDLPFPTQQVLFHDQTEATDGDRARQREGWPARPGEDAPTPRRIVDGLARLRAGEEG